MNAVNKLKSVAEYITGQINLCGKSQFEIAKESGFEKPNIITMIKQGRTKLPLDKVGKFSKAIEVDPVFLFKLCMNEYWPDTWAELQKIMGQPTLSENELGIIEVIRESNVINPKINKDSDRERLLEVINTFDGDNAYYK